jgi:menaquinone-9 beta-reductase
VGAGPAGAAAACHFARAGFRVALIDQRRFPRDKVCGDFLGPGALAELDELGVSARPAVRDANKIRTGALYLGGVNVVGRAFPHAPGVRDFGVCIPRQRLDDAIVRAAVASGTRLIEGARVTGYETDATGVTLFHQGGAAGQRLRARLLIGADGSSSLIARMLRGAKSPPRDRIVAVRAYFDGVLGAADQADLYVNATCFPGYCWLFPVGATAANVGVEMPFAAWKQTKPQLGQLLATWIRSEPGLRERLANANPRGPIVGWPLATFNARLPLVADRVALIGDAAGLISPLSGEGIQYALQSARWALEALHHAVLSDRLSAAGLRPYAGRVRAELRYDMALSRLLVDLASNPALAPLWLATLRGVAQRRASDSAYYEVAAGVFAGVVPARALLALPFAWRTVVSTALTGGAAALDALCGPRDLLAGGGALAKAVGAMLKTSISHPVRTLEWGAGCAVGVVELATQLAASAARELEGVGERATPFAGKTTR